MAMRKFDPGKTSPVVLYDLAVMLSAASYSCLDPDSELFQAFNELLCSVWNSLPSVVTIDNRDPDEEW